MNVFEFGEHKIHYDVKRTARRRSVGIQVLPDTRVVFRVPQRFSGDLKTIFEKHAVWILKKQNYFRKRPIRELVPAEPVTVEALKLYRAEAFQKVTESVRRFQPFIGIHPNKISIRNQRSLWGSCNRKNHLSFNWRLVLLPPEILDYVVVHEMCHMIHHNHSRLFWEKVRAVLPDYLEKRRWLKKRSIR